jgi:Predicted membrane protein
MGGAAILGIYLLTNISGGGSSTGGGTDSGGGGGILSYLPDLGTGQQQPNVTNNYNFPEEQASNNRSSETPTKKTVETMTTPKSAVTEGTVGTGFGDGGVGGGGGGGFGGARGDTPEKKSLTDYAKQVVSYHPLVQSYNLFTSTTKKAAAVVRN